MDDFNMFKKPNYDHIARDTDVKLSITADEMKAILYAYDRGIKSVDDEAIATLDEVMNKLKDQLWP